MAVQPGTYSFTVQRRASYSLDLQFKDSNDAAIDLTGFTVYAQAWDEARTKKSADFSVTYTNRSNGQISLSLTSTQTSGFPDKLYYDVLLEDSGGSREYYLEGVINVSQGYSSP